MTTCQARDLALIDYGDDVPACDEPGTEPVNGYVLCAECRGALEVLTELLHRPRRWERVPAGVR